MWDPALVIIGLVVSTPPKEEWHTVTFMTAAMHHTQCVVHAAGINALHVLHSMQSVWTTRATTALALASHPVDEYHEPSQVLALRGCVVHTFYVDVMTTSTMLLGTITAVSLHAVVWSTTTS